MKTELDASINNNNNNECEQFLISTTRTKPTSSNKITMKNYHSHSHYEILYLSSCSSAKVAFHIGKKKYICDSHSIMLSSPETPHYTSRSQSGFERIIINFTKRYVMDIKSFCGIDIDEIFSKNVLTFTTESINELKSLAHKMIKEYKNNSENLYLRLLLCEFLYLLSTPDSYAVPLDTSSAMFEDIMLYLHNNYHDRITLKSLQNKFFVSKKTICGCIKKHTDLSFVDILTNVRINHARELLESSEIPVNLIVEKVGFNSQSYFSTVFKKHTGLSPSDYRQIYK